MQIQAKNKTVEVFLYEDIGGWFGITANQFVKEVKDAAKGMDKIVLRINSNGGNVFDGVAIYNYLKQSQQKVVVHIDGLAASIASVIAMSGDEINIADNGWMMIHDPWIVTGGTADDLRGVAETMDGIRETLLDTYMKRASKTREEISQMMTDETWLNASDALDAGLVDEVTGAMDVAASVHKTWFKQIPDNLQKDEPKQGPQIITEPPNNLIDFTSRPRREQAKNCSNRMALALRKIKAK